MLVDESRAKDYLALKTYPVFTYIIAVSTFVVESFAFKLLKIKFSAMNAFFGVHHE